MKPSSAKKKGRRIIEELREAILRAFPELDRQDIVIQPTSVGGEDLRLSPTARRLFPFAVEGKNQQALNIWAAIAQAETNANGNPPAVVFRRNHHSAWVCISLVDMLNLLQRVQEPFQRLKDEALPTVPARGKYDKRKAIEDRMGE